MTTVQSLQPKYTVYSDQSVSSKLLLIFQFLFHQSAFLELLCVRLGPQRGAIKNILMTIPHIGCLENSDYPQGTS